MKQTLLTLSFVAIGIFVTACSTNQITDEMAVVGNPSLSSDPCAAIDEKVLKLDRFTEVVKHTSAFHLEEKANAIPTPGITVSTNRKQMLKDAEKKYAEYAAEREKYGCEVPANRGISQTTEKMAILDSCTAIDEKIIRLDSFTEMVKNTSAFHLEEKANALPSPGFTVSNNKKQMLRDAKKKRAEYQAERQKYGCKTPMPVSSVNRVDKTRVSQKSTMTSDLRTSTEKEVIKSNESKTNTNDSVAVHSQERSVAPSVSENTVSQAKAPSAVAIEKKTAAAPVSEHPKQSVATPVISDTAPMDRKTATTEEPVFSSEACNDLNKELKELNEFTEMVNNTSAFHLEEKLRAWPSPGFTVSSNKKKILRDAEKKRKKLLTEQKKAGCKSL